MGLRQVPLFLVILTALSLSLGCGIIPGFGGEDEDADLGMIEFADDGEIVLEPEEIIAGALSSIDPEVLIEIRFLYYFQVRLERLRQLIRDLNSAVEHSGPVDVNLDWVIEVHDVTRESDDFFRVLTSLDVPESQREQYQHLQIGMLETVQVAAYGADRILAASVVVGPSGRSMLNMDIEEIDRFETLLREARFFLSDATSRVEREIDEVSQAVRGLGLR